MPNSRYATRTGSLVLTALVIVGIAIGTTAMPIAASFADDLTSGDIAWLALVVALTAILAAGLAMHRPPAGVDCVAHDRRSRTSARLFLAPPTCLLAIAIASAAVLTRRRHRPVTTAG